MTRTLKRWSCFTVALALAGCGGDDKPETMTLPTRTNSTTNDQDRVPAVRPSADTNRRPITKPQADKVRLGVTRREVEKLLGPPGRVRAPTPRSKTVCTVYGALTQGGRQIAAKQVWLICYDRAGKSTSLQTRPRADRPVGSDADFNTQRERPAPDRAVPDPWRWWRRHERSRHRQCARVPGQRRGADDHPVRQG